jgi:hypothetical protein
VDVNHIPSPIDLRLNLLSGEPLFSGNIEVKPFTLREINKVGFSSYMKHVGILTLDKKAVIEDDPELDKYSLFEIILLSKNDFLLNTFLDTLCLFLREDRENVIVNRAGFIFNGKTMNPKEAKIIDSNAFNDLIQIVKYQNCMTSPNESYERPVPVDERTRKIQEKLKKAREAVAEIKQKQSKSNIDFADIVSSVSTKSNTYNKHNVWDLTMYQLYDEYKRLEAISSYEVSIMAMVQGAKIDDLKHWSSKIEE